MNPDNALVQVGVTLAKVARYEIALCITLGSSQRLPNQRGRVREPRFYPTIRHNVLKSSSIHELER
jgi:hypothetical protein